MMAQIGSVIRVETGSAGHAMAGRAIARVARRRLIPIPIPIPIRLASMYVDLGLEELCRVLLVLR